MSTEYRKDWKTHYGRLPYSKLTEGSVDLTPTEYAKNMTTIFEDVGVIELARQQKIAILGTSISSGEKDFALMDALDKKLSGISEKHKPRIVLSDFALQKDGRPVIPNKQFEHENITVTLTTADSYKLPFPTDSFTIIYERLGALYHAADQDHLEKTQMQNTEEMLIEYKRVLQQGGTLIIDWINTRTNISTVEAIKEVIPDKDIELFFQKMGFTIELVGDQESFFILRKK